MNSLCSFQLAFTFSFCTQWLTWIKAPSNLKKKKEIGKKSVYTIPLLFMFPTRTTITRLEINEIWKFSLTALLIEKQTSFVQKHSRETFISLCKLFCPSFGATVKLCQRDSESLVILFLGKGGWGRRKDFHKIEIQMTELIFRGCGIFLTPFLPSQTNATAVSAVSGEKKSPQTTGVTELVLDDCRLILAIPDPG